MLYPKINQSGSGHEGNSFGVYFAHPAEMIETREQTDWGLSTIMEYANVGKHTASHDLAREAATIWLARHDDSQLPFNKGWAQEAHLRAHRLLAIPVAL